MSPEILSPVLPPPSSFIEERKYLKNVTPSTLAWYTQAFKSFEGCQREEDFKTKIITLRRKGLSPVSINSWLRCINAYLLWAKAGFKLPKLQEPKKLLPTLSKDHISHILTIKPKGLNNQRIQTLAAVLLDTGLRIDEALHLRWQDVDLDNLLVKVMGKGRKERLVPVSLEGRKWLFLWRKVAPASTYVFSTGSGTALSQRNAQRDLARFCKALGITGVRSSPHTLRHSFAVAYLRNGGNLEYLRRILGHTSLQITQRYLQSLTPEDLGTVHNSFTPLAGV